MTILKVCSKLCLLSFLMFCGIEDSNAQQMSLVPLGYNPMMLDYVEANPASNARNNQACPDDTLSMPFYDDFSSTPTVYPNCSHWQDNHVFINNDMAYRPPSIGVATFDGLTSIGTPYNIAASPAAGYPADTLTSQAINLSGKTASDDIFLSFFYQAQGLSDRPEVQDSFILEFKDSNNTWNIVWDTSGVLASASTLALFEFTQQFIPIDSGKYLYNGFQFRFRNLASITGNNDHWHLDYIYLDENRALSADSTAGNVNYGRHADVAFTHRPTSPLKNNYTAMPWRHCVDSSCFAENFIIRNFNHNIVVGTLDRLCEVEEINPTNALLSEGIPALQYFPSTVPDVLDQDSLNHTIISNFSSFNPTQKTILETTYTILNPTDFQSNPIFSSNDTVKTQTVLDNYFAYDDGTAETRVIAQGLGTKIAVEFTAEVDDTLQGIYFHLPYYTNDDAQDNYMNVKVWLDDLTGPEVFSRDLARLEYIYGFNGFYFVDMVNFLQEKILIPIQAGQKFYVGWQQSFGEAVPVGFDRSTDSRHRTFIGTGASWDTATIKGTVMIRPLLSPDTSFTLIPINVVEQQPANPLTIYPNPTKDILNLSLGNYERADDYTIYIYNAMGQQIHAARFEQQLSVRDWQTGLYILTLRDENGKQISQQKIIKH